MFELCIPARNEGRIIQDVLRRLTESLDAFDIDWRISVVVNGTTDNTIEQICEFQTINGKYQELIKSVVRPEAGKGAAIRFAAQNSQADVFGFIDADLSADPDVIMYMVKMVMEGRADVVIGSRLLDTKTTDRNWLRTLSSRLFNLAARVLLGIKVKDAQCGLKVMNDGARRLLIEGREPGWFMDIEFLARVVQDKLAIIEVPVSWREHRYAGRKSQLSMLKDGVGSSLQAMLRIRRRKSEYV